MVRVTAHPIEPGVTPCAFLAVVEYVDPDGELRHDVIASDGASPARIDRLRALLAPPPSDDAAPVIPA